MLKTGNMSPLGDAAECVRDVPAIGQKVQTALRILQGMENCCHLPSLGGLMRAMDGAMGSLAAEIGESPSSSGTSWRGMTSAFSGDDGGSIGYERYGAPGES